MNTELIKEFVGVVVMGVVLGTMFAYALLGGFY